MLSLIATISHIKWTNYYESETFDCPRPKNSDSKTTSYHFGCPAPPYGHKANFGTIYIMLISGSTQRSVLFRKQTLKTSFVFHIGHEASFGANNVKSISGSTPAYSKNSIVLLNVIKPFSVQLNYILFFSGSSQEY